MAMGVYCFAGADNPTDTSVIDAEIAAINAALDVVETNAYLKSEQFILYQDMDGNLQKLTNIASVISGSYLFATNSTQMFTGTALGTNYVAFIDGTNTYRIKFNH